MHQVLLCRYLREELKAEDLGEGSVLGLPPRVLLNQNTYSFDLFVFWYHVMVHSSDDNLHCFHISVQKDLSRQYQYTN